MTQASLTITTVDGIGEVVPGDDLAALLAAAADLQDGDIVVLTSKVVSKAEGRIRRVTDDFTRESAIDAETDRVVATRGPTRIVRNHLGLTMAAAGVDASNTPAGTIVLLPTDPDASARRIREGLLALTGADVAVIITDTAGRAWRHGQTDLAIGAAGIEVLEDFAGRIDAHGHELRVTAPAIADELAGAGDLVKGKLSGSPAAVVRGLTDWVLPAHEHGPGARTLVRGEHEDMFGYGAREAVAHAIHADAARGFGDPAPVEEVAAALGRLTPVEAVAGLHVPLTGNTFERGRLAARLEAIAWSYGWVVVAQDEEHQTVAFGPRA